jgi:integrase
MRKALTDLFIRNLAAPAAGRIEIADVREAGLSFRVTSKDARSWCFRFRDPRSGRTSRATIGDYPDVSLADARERANIMRRQVAAGENPVEARRRERELSTTKTFQALADRYLNEHARRHKRSADADDRNLRLHVLPKWRNRRYDDIGRADVIELVEGLVSAGKQTLANRVQALVSSIFSFAMDADLVKGNPCARLRRRGVETVGRRVLSDDEIRLFWPTILQKPVSRRVGLAIRLVLLTGVRPGEAAGAARAELVDVDDKNKAKWIIPGTRTKNGRAHLVPLSEMARQTILSALQLTDARQSAQTKAKTVARPKTQDASAFLFPSRSVENAPITAHALAVAMARFAEHLDRDAGKSWHTDPPSPHDLRRTLATRLAALGIPKEDRDAVLNHTPRDVGKKHYDLYEREREKRHSLNLWATTLAAIVEKQGHTTAPKMELPDGSNQAELISAI